MLSYTGNQKQVRNEHKSINQMLLRQYNVGIALFLSDNVSECEIVCVTYSIYS